MYSLGCKFLGSSAVIEERLVLVEDVDLRDSDVVQHGKDARRAHPSRASPKLLGRACRTLLEANTTCAYDEEVA